MKQTHMPLESFKAISITMTGGLDQKAFSEALKRYCPAGKGISQSSVSNFLNGKLISKAAANRVNVAYEKWQETGGDAPSLKINTPAPSEDYEVLSESPLSDNGTFKLVMPVVKGEDGKFMSLADVDPKKVRLPDAETYHPDATEEATTLHPAMHNPTDEELLAEMLETFNVMNTMTRGCLTGTILAMTIRGPAGLGKSHPTFEIVNNEAAATGTKVWKIKGSMSAPGLYKTLYKARNGGLVLIDDCDSVFGNEDCLNYLKAALDTSDVRSLNCEKAANYVYDEETVDLIVERMKQKSDENDEDFEMRKDDKRFDLTIGKAPKHFVFEGRVIFITNKDLLKMANSGTAIAEHVAPIVSRSLYLDIDMDSDRQKMVWVEYIFNTFMWDKQCGLTREQADELLAFVKENYKDMQEISNRLMKICSSLFKLGPNWKNVIRKTKMKRKVRYIVD